MQKLSSFSSVSSLCYKSTQPAQVMYMNKTRKQYASKTLQVPIKYRHISNRHSVKAHASGMVENVEALSYYAGKSIILFTMFYCSLNWLHYRNLRKQIFEKDDNDSKKD